VADAYSNRGYIEMNNLDVDEAILDFARAIHCYADPSHYHRRGQARLLTEDFDGAIEDFNSALSLKTENEFLTSMIYVHRGYALLLQGKEKSAETDFQRTEVGPGQRIMIELHLRTLENQIKLIRRRRLAKQRNIS
jgi:tetratricopeptide (TPR) repeat protein